MPTAATYIEPLESRIAPATIIVTSDLDSGPGSLRAALALADDPMTHPGHDTIVFKFPIGDISDGAVTIPITSGQLTTLGDVTISGPGAGKLILDANGTSRILDINPAGANLPNKGVLISGLSMIRGNSVDGAAIEDTGLSLTLNHVVISGNSATGDGGGGVEIAGSTVETNIHISNSLIAGNTADFAGGLNLNDLKSLTMTNTVVTGNKVTDPASIGGGVSVEIGSTSTATISGCLISDNSADNGGGLYLNGATETAKFNITNTVISGNSSTTTAANYGGGGIALETGHFAISGCTISNNTAVYDGGGLFAKNFSKVTISNSTFSGNQTTKENANDEGGGGAFIYGNGSIPAQPVVISGSHFVNNQTALSGAGLNAANGDKVMISNSTFSGNHAASNGGALFTYGGDAAISVKSSVFADNVAVGAGGGMFASDDGGVSITSSKLTGNVANIGGGARVGSYGVLAIKGNIIANNIATTRGGGIETVNSNHFVISGGSITGNASAKGGGVYCYDGTTGTTYTGLITGVTITGNYASTSGGGVASYGSNAAAVEVQISKIFGNTGPIGIANTAGNITYT